MTIKGAIAWLQALQGKHGGDVVIFFDCPKCETSYTPDTVVAEPIRVIHVKADKGVQG